MPLSGSVVDTTVSLSSGGFFPLSSEKGFFPVFFPVFVHFLKQFFCVPFRLFGNRLSSLLFQIRTCFNVGSIHKNRFRVQISFLCRGFQHPPEHMLHRGVVKPVLEVVTYREKCGTASFSGYPMNHLYARFMLTSSEFGGAKEARIYAGSAQS